MGYQSGGYSFLDRSVAPWQCIADLAPRLFAAIPKRRVKQRTVRDVLTNRAWISDIQGALTFGVVVDYLHLWDLLMDFQLQPEVEDRHFWRLSSNGQYWLSWNTKVSFSFLGSTLFGPCERIWKSRAPPKCRFIVWLVPHNKCSTADHLARHGQLHPEYCPLCDQEEGTINHLLVHCVFAREFWFNLFRQVFRPCPLSLQNYPSMLGGRKLAAAPLMG